MTLVATSIELMPPTELATGEVPAFQSNDPDPVLSTRKYCPGVKVRFTGNTAVVPPGSVNGKVAIAVLTLDPRLFVKSSRGVHGQVAPVILYQRTDFAASMIDGRTVMETTATGRSAQEIAELWKCVSAQMTIRAAA